MVRQQQTMIALMSDAATLTLHLDGPTATAEPRYAATVVAQNAALLARDTAPAAALHRTAIAQTNLLLTAQALAAAAMGTQIAQNTSLIRIAQTSNALTDNQNTLLRTVRDNSAQALKLQSTAISLAAAANAIANKQLQQATSTDATAIAIQRSQTGVLVAQSATQKDIAYQTALTSYYACRTMLNTKPAITLTCSKPKK
jgi:hypothetical protein